MRPQKNLNAGVTMLMIGKEKITTYSIRFMVETKVAANVEADYQKLRQKYLLETRLSGPQLLQ